MQENKTDKYLQVMYFILQCIKFVSKLQHISMKKNKLHMKVTENREVGQQTQYMAWTLTSSSPPPPLMDQATHCMLQRQLFLQCNVQDKQIKKGF